MLSFVSLILEQFFTKPTDVIATNISILLLLAPLNEVLDKFGLWYAIFIIYNSITLAVAVLALLLLDKDNSPDALPNVISRELNRFSTFFGNGRFLWFALFFLCLIFYIDNQSPTFLVFFAYATIVLLVDPKRYALSFSAKRKGKNIDVGDIFGVQSSNTFLARLYDKQPKVERFDVVEFRYSKDGSPNPRSGLIIDDYMLDQQQWIRILNDSVIQTNIELEPSEKLFQPNTVYLADNQSAKAINKTPSWNGL